MIAGHQEEIDFPDILASVTLSDAGKSTYQRGEERMKGLLIVACLVCGSIGHAGVAFGQGTVSPSPGLFGAQVGRYLYIGAGVGGFFAQSASFSAMGNLHGLPISTSGKLAFDPSPALLVFGSYALTDYINIAPEIGYVRSNIQKFDGLVSIPLIGAVDGSENVNGDVATLAGLVNCIVTPLGQDRRITPYFGGGLGFASSNASLRSITLVGNSLPIGVNSRETDFAADILAGFEYRMTRNAYAGIAYQFIHVNSGHLGSGDGLKANTGSLSAHIVAALFEYRF